MDGIRTRKVTFMMSKAPRGGMAVQGRGRGGGSRGEERIGEERRGEDKEEGGGEEGRRSAMGSKRKRRVAAGGEREG